MIYLLSFRQMILCKKLSGTDQIQVEILFKYRISVFKQNSIFKNVQSIVN